MENRSQAATSRIRRTFLMGVHALNQSPDDALWEEFQKNENMNGPFEELLCEGKYDEALSVFRAHIAYDEIDVQELPDIITRALPTSLGRKFTRSSLEDLLLWMDRDVSPRLNAGASVKMNELRGTLAKNLAHKVLSMNSDVQRDHEAVIRNLELSCLVAKSHSNDSNIALARFLDETCQLIRIHKLFRPARLLIMVSEKTQDAGEFWKDIYNNDIDAMLLRGADDLDKELTNHVKPWCDYAKVSLDDVLYRFLSNQDLILDERWAHLLRFIDNKETRVATVLLFLRRACPPFPQWIFSIIDDSMISLPRSPEFWQKEKQALRIREVAAKYGIFQDFDVTRRLRSLRDHLIARCVSTSSLQDHCNTWDDLVVLSTSSALPHVAAQIVSMLPETAMSTADYRTKLMRIMSSIPRNGSRQLIVKESLAYARMSLNHLAASRSDEIEMIPGEENAAFRFASMGMVLLDYITEELDASAMRVDITEWKLFFESHLESAEVNDMEVSNLSTISTGSTPMGFQNLASTEHFQLNNLQEYTPDNLFDFFGELSKKLLLSDIRSLCDRSVLGNTTDDNEENTDSAAFRDCPNVLTLTEVFVPVKNLIAGPRFMASQHSAPKIQELHDICDVLDGNGATQAALRLRSFIKYNILNVYHNDIDLSLDNAYFRLASAALQRPVLDSYLVLGYLISVQSTNSGYLLFMAESKRLNDAFQYLQLHWMNQKKIRSSDSEDVGNAEDDCFAIMKSFDMMRLESLSRIGKKLGEFWGKPSLINECDRSAKVAKWLSWFRQTYGDTFTTILDIVKFIKGDEGYIRQVSLMIFRTRFFMKGDYAYHQSKYHLMKSFFEDFAWCWNSLCEGFTQAIAAFVRNENGSTNFADFDEPTLVDSISHWSKHATRTELVDDVNTFCLSLVGRDNDREILQFRICTALLVVWAPECESYLKRGQMVLEFRDRLGRLLANPSETLCQIYMEGQKRAMELDVLAMVHSGLELSKSWDDFCLDYLEVLLRLSSATPTSPPWDFKQDVIPLLDSVSGQCDRKWRLIDQMVQGGDGAAEPTLSRTKDRLLCLKYLNKHLKRQRVVTGDKLEARIKLVEAQFIFEKLHLHAFIPVLTSLVQEADAKAIVKLVFEATGPNIPDDDVFQASKLLLVTLSGQSSLTSAPSLSELLKRLVLEWLEIPVQVFLLQLGKENTATEAMSKPFENDYEQWDAADMVLVRVISRALRYLAIDVKQFVHKFAYGNNPRQTISSASRARALRVLKSFELATDERLLQRRLIMAEFEFCRSLLGTAWKQTSDQIFADESMMVRAVEGLLRDLPISKVPLRCTALTFRLVMHAIKLEKAAQSQLNVEEQGRMISKALTAFLKVDECVPKVFAIVNSLTQVSLACLNSNAVFEGPWWTYIGDTLSHRAAELGSSSVHESGPDPKLIACISEYLGVLERLANETVALEQAKTLLESLTLPSTTHGTLGPLKRRAEMLLFRLSL